MAPFRFRLERMLKYRFSEEESARLELKRRRAHLEDAAAKTTFLEEEAAKVAESFRQQSCASLNLPLLELTGEYYRLVNRHLGEQYESLQRSARQVDEQAEAARLYWRRRRVLEMLQDRARTEHSRQEKLQESRFLDELTLYSFDRKQ